MYSTCVEPPACMYMYMYMYVPQCSGVHLWSLAVHCGSSKQTASIISMNKELLRTGDKATCLFRFIKNPEYLRPGARMVFREGRTKAVGNITKIFPHVPGISPQGGKPKMVQHSHPQLPGVGRSRGKGRRGGRKKGGVRIPSGDHISSGGSATSLPANESTPPISST